MLLCILGIDTQYTLNRSAGFALDVGIKMRINACRGAHIAVPEPHLDNLHIDILGDQERRAGVYKAYALIYLRKCDIIFLILKKGG